MGLDSNEEILVKENKKHSINVQQMLKISRYESAFSKRNRKKKMYKRIKFFVFGRGLYFDSLCSVTADFACIYIFLIKFFFSTKNNYKNKSIHSKVMRGYT